MTGPAYGTFRDWWRCRGLEGVSPSLRLHIVAGPPPAAPPWAPWGFPLAGRPQGSWTAFMELQDPTWSILAIEGQVTTLMLTLPWNSRQVPLTSSAILVITSESQVHPDSRGGDMDLSSQ